MKCSWVPLVSLLCMVSPAFGSDAAHGWTFRVAPYVWAAGLEGEIGVQGVTADVDLSFSDLVEEVDMGFMGQFEARNGRFGLVASPMWISMSGEASGPAGFFDASITAESTVFDGFATFAVTPKLEVLGGLRYTELDCEIELQAPGAQVSVTESKSWIDPIVGVRYVHQVAARWSLLFRADIGVAGDSDSIWRAAGLIGYELSRRSTLVFGYSALDYDYEEGSPASRFTWNVTMDGPIVGIGFALD